MNGRDLASHILTADVGSLTEPQRMFRYFTRISNMCGKVSLGRNQAALGFLLRNKNLVSRIPSCPPSLLPAALRRPTHHLPRRAA